MTESNKWMLFSGLVVTGFLLYILSPILLPFMVAAILAYIADPLVDKLETCRLPRILAVVVVFAGLTLVALILLLIFVPLLEKQFVVLANKLPGYIDRFQNTVLPWLAAQFGSEEMSLELGSLKSSIQEYWKTAGSVLKNVLAYITRSGMAVIAWLVNLVLIIIVTFYMLRDWDEMVARVHALLPRRIEPVIVRLAKESDEILGAFLRGQLLVMMSLATVYSTGLFIVGLDLALIIGLIAGLVSFVPYLGFIIGIVAATIAAIMQFQDLIHVIYVVIVFGIGQMLEGMLLTPLLVGDRIGLHPVAVIFAVLAGGQLFGFFGILLALPVAALIMVLLRYVLARYKNSNLYGPAVTEESQSEQA